MGKWKRNPVYEDMLVTLVHRTERALKLSIDPEAEPMWFPLSQMDDRADELLDEGDEAEIGISEWILQQKGWL